MRALSMLVATLLPAVTFAEGMLNVYGPGGPAPAMKEAAEAFGKASGLKVEVTAGPTDKWIAKAREDADVIYSGAENMMTDFVRLMEGRIAEPDVVTLYLRPSAILVRPGNPRRVKDLPDLLQPGMKVLVVQGAGQDGMWEDMIGRTGDAAKVHALRKNIVVHAPNTGEAKQIWTERPEIDAWIVFNIWHIANPKIADLVPVSKEYVMYRSTGAALTARGKQNPRAAEFVEFLRSKQGAAIFEKWGWRSEWKGSVARAR